MSLEVPRNHNAIHAPRSKNLGSLHLKTLFLCYELQYFCAFPRFSCSQELFTQTLQNRCWKLHGNLENSIQEQAPEMVWKRRQKNIWVLVCDSRKPSTLGVQNRFQIDGNTILGPVRRPWCPHGSPGSLKRAEIVESVPKIPKRAQFPISQDLKIIGWYDRVIIEHMLRVAI